MFLILWSLVDASDSTYDDSYILNLTCANNQLKGHGNIEMEHPVLVGSIPRVIISTGPWRPESIIHSNLHTAAIRTVFFDDIQMDVSAREISDELESQGVSGVYDAFLMLRPMAFRADLWRLMKLWAHGGIYLDSKLQIVGPLDWIDFNNRLVICKDIQKTAPGLFSNAVIAARPRLEELKRYIAEIVRNIQSRSYGFGSIPWLNITGPGLSTRFLKAVVPCEFIIDDDLSRDSIRVVTNRVIMRYVSWVHRAMDGTGYYRHWRKSQVYCDEPGPLCKHTSANEMVTESFIRKMEFLFGTSIVPCRYIGDVRRYLLEQDKVSLYRIGRSLGDWNTDPMDYSLNAMAQHIIDSVRDAID